MEENYKLERDVIQKLNIIKKNKEEINRLKALKNGIYDEMAKKGTYGLEAKQLADIVDTQKAMIKEINDEISPYTEGNDTLQQAIADEIIEDYEQRNVDTNLLVDVTKEYPGIATVQIKSERILELNEKMKEKVIQELYENDMLEYLDINLEKYFELSKEIYGKTKKHVLGVVEMTPTHKVKISFKK